MSKRDRRIQKRSEAALVVEQHSGPIMRLLVDVITDLAPEVDGLHHFEQDAAFAAELAYRLDNSIQFTDPLFEALDGVITFFVALGALGIYRSIIHREKLRGKRLDRRRERLEVRGPKMAKAARFRLERRISRLAAK